MNLNITTTCHYTTLYAHSTDQSTKAPTHDNHTDIQIEQQKKHQAKYGQPQQQYGIRRRGRGRNPRREGYITGNL